MKRFLFLMGIVLIVASCNSGKNQSSTQTNDSSISTRSSTAQQDSEMTLNGYTKADAGVMVNAFLGKPGPNGKPGPGPGVYDKKSTTNIWFSRQYVNSLDSMLHKEGANGIRFYFARNKDDDKYNVIIVSTKEKNGVVRQDYFEHNAQFLQLVQAKGIVDYSGKPGSGARLYTKKSCPSLETCNVMDNHYVKCDKAYEWVQNYTKDLINTTSEWFEIDFLDKLVTELKTTTKDNTPDGVRIYYSRKTEPDRKGRFRHHFLVMTTGTTPLGSKIDYFECNHKFSEDKVNIATAVLRGLDNGEQCKDACDNGITWPD